MKRPMLICGIGILSAGAVLMLFPQSLPYIVPLCALVFVFYLIKPLNLRKHIVIPTVLIAITLFAISLAVFNKSQITPLKVFDQTEEYISGKVITTPEEDYFGNFKFILKADKIGNDDVDTKIQMLLPGKNAKNLDLYNIISIENCYLELPRNDNGSFNKSSFADGYILEGVANNCKFLWEAEKTPYYYCLLLKEAINNKIDNYLLSDDSALLKGMLFGDTEDMSYSVKQAYRNSGIAHLLAVSGLHTALWCALLINVLSLFKLPEKAKSIFCLVFLGFFTIITGFTPSVVRSVIMAGVVLVAPFFKRKPDSLNSLGLSVALILLNNPYAILSVSFQLSAIATLGVLVSLPTAYRSTALCNKLPQKHLINLSKSIVSTAVITVFSGLFTLPVSTYYFGVFSLLSPITNVLTITLSFYIMIIGSIACAISFINIPFMKDVTIVIFKVTKFLMDLLTEIAEIISNISICTIPVHKSFLVIGVIAAALIISAGYIIYKRKNKLMLIKRLTAVIAVLFLFTSISIPLWMPKYKNTLTVISSGSNVNIVVRSGVRYAYICVNSESNFPKASDYLPKATSESLDIYAPRYLTYRSVTDIEKIREYLSPEETRVTEHIKNTAKKRNIDLPRNTIIENEGYFSLNNEINFVIVDTYGSNYAIIESENTKAIIELDGNTDIGSLSDSKDADILVYKNRIPSNIDENKTIIINGSSNLYLKDDLKELLKENENLYYTPLDGSVNINL